VCASLESGLQSMRVHLRCLYDACMMRLPNSERAVLDIRKIEDYCLNPEHPRGRHKARVFRELLGATRNDAPWLRDALLDAVQNSEAIELAADAFGSRWRADVSVSRHGKNVVIRTMWIVRTGGGCAPVRDLLGAVMTEDQRPAVLDVVALLADLPSEGLARGQVGTVVETLDERTVLVEFTDDQGRAYAVAPSPRSDLLVLHYVPQAA